MIANSLYLEVMDAGLVLCADEKLFIIRSEFPMILVANKADLESERVVSNLFCGGLYPPSLTLYAVNACRFRSKRGKKSHSSSRSDCVKLLC